VLLEVSLELALDELLEEDEVELDDDVELEDELVSQSGQPVHKNESISLSQ